MSVLGTWDELIPNRVIEKAEELARRVSEERGAGKELYPPQEHIFRALALPPEEVKVVILGQDPYHEEGQANGLSFSVNRECPIPPSLRNIFKELADEYGWAELPSHGDLTYWAKQGVLLLNTFLTVYAGDANSCQNWGWDEITKAVLHACMLVPQPVVFLLWGRNAYNAAIESAVMEEPCKHIIFSSHPSPLGATKSGESFSAFFGSGQFREANVWLSNHGVKPVDWELHG